MSSSVRYPVQFDIARRKAIGEPSYLNAEEARRNYEGGKSLRVVADGESPSWFMLVTPQRHRFTVTYYAQSGTPLREATWEEDAGALLCRRVIDLFYVDGDPGMRVPYSDTVSVTRHVSSDGVIGVTMASPVGDDEFRETTVSSVEGARRPEPTFGQWHPLVEARDVGDEGRFGIDAIDAAVAALNESAGSVDSPATDALTAPGRWRVSLSGDEIIALVGHGLDDAAVPVLSRGVARILPLIVVDGQAAPGGIGPEDRRRMSVMAAEIGDALEHRAGRGIVVDLTNHGADSVATYVAALRDAGASEARVWDLGDERAAALVWTTDERAGTTALALHVVPVTWIDERRSGVPTYDLDLRWSPSDVGLPGAATA